MEVVESNVSPESILESAKLLADKAKELFEVCDKERKGFITKRDMQRLRGELNLSAEQLEEVFDTLDLDSSGSLTIEEFCNGFSSYLGLDFGSMSTKQKSSESDSSDGEIEGFYELLERLQDEELFRDKKDIIYDMWRRLKKGDQESVQHFENFLSHISVELKRTQTEYFKLESVLKNRSNVHDKEVKRLYEEMEQLVEAERKKVLQEEEIKDKKVKEELEEELRKKEIHLQEIILKQSQMEANLKNMNSFETETKQKNWKLQQERDNLELRLAESEKTLQELQNNLGNLKQTDVLEKRERLKSVMKVSEGIALEREGLVKQLNLLRSVNRTLLDEKDLVILGANNNNNNDTRVSNLERIHSLDSNASSHHSETESETSLGRVFSRTARRGSVIADYIEQKNKLSLIDGFEIPLPNRHNPFSNNRLGDEDSDGSSCLTGDYYSPVPIDLKSENSYVSFDSVSNDGESWIGKHEFNSSHYRGVNPFLEGFFDSSVLPLNGNTSSILTKGEFKVKRSIYSDSDGETQERWTEKVRIFPKVNQRNTVTLNPKVEEISQLSEASSNPDRIYKVVFIGDSGVGKSSFIHRFCHDDFRSSFSATIGVDFRVKSVYVDGQFVALQLWDTAGQERFRSVTKQYYRKADGVIIMFDVTSETSFKNITSWLNDVKEGSDASTVVMVIGNKTDLCLREETRVIKGRDGEKLAEDNGALYFETSAKLGDGIEDCMLSLAALLQKREDETIEKSLRLRDTIKKRKCCNS